MREQSLRLRESGFHVAGGEQSVVSDLDELLGQHVEQESADELLGGEGAGLGAAGAEGDAVVGDAQQPRGGDGDAVGVAAEVAHDVLGAAEGAFGVDDPVAALGGAHEFATFGFGEVDVAGVAEVDQAGEELAAEYLADGGDGEEEGVVGGLDPLRAVGAEAAAGDDGVQVGVEEECAGPGVQNEREANLGTEPLGVGGEGEERA